MEHLLKADKGQAEQTMDRQLEYKNRSQSFIVWLHNTLGKWDAESLHQNNS